MSKRSKAYQEAVKKLEAGRFYSVTEAAALAIETAGKKTNSTIEVALKLGVDPKKADQMIRGTVSLPHGTGKTARVIVFANGAAADAARAAGADEVGSDELIAKVEAGWTDFDAAVATPDLMGKVGKLGKVLGPRNLMPNPKTGTVTMEVGKAVEEVKAGKIDFKVDKYGIVHSSVGKVSFEGGKIRDNAHELIQTLLKLKPSAAKGTYIKSIYLSSTMSPGIQVDTKSVVA